MSLFLNIDFLLALAAGVFIILLAVIIKKFIVPLLDFYIIEIKNSIKNSEDNKLKLEQDLKDLADNASKLKLKSQSIIDDANKKAKIHLKNIDSEINNKIFPKKLKSLNETLLNQESEVLIKIINKIISSMEYNIEKIIIDKLKENDPIDEKDDWSDELFVEISNKVNFQNNQ